MRNDVRTVGAAGASECKNYNDMSDTKVQPAVMGDYSIGNILESKLRRGSGRVIGRLFSHGWRNKIQN